MAGPPWDDEVVSERLVSNLAELSVAIPSESGLSRVLPTVELARGWHRKMLECIDVPDDAYRGGFRGDPHPALIDYEVTVGGLAVSRASDVPQEVGHLTSLLQERIPLLDKLGEEGNPAVLDPDFVRAALEVAAWLHCEWVRIHPLVNGNGRTARMWILWLCGRYGLPALLTLRPRPESGYIAATQLGMIGEHGLFLQYLLVRYNALPAGS
jgi:hypothetical protein